MKLTHIYPLFLSLLIISACEIVEFQSTNPVGIVEGVRPVYAPVDGWDDIIATDPQPIEYLGKIYYKDQFIYVNERYKGIHILDNSNPSSPISIKFIHVPGNEDIAIKGDILYVDNLTDLVAIDISNLDQIKVTSRLEGLYEESKKNYPDGYSGYFECVDTERGIVIGWEEVTLENPTCFR